MTDKVHDTSRFALAQSPYLIALRPHQWLKNFLVFIPMLASHRLTWEIAFQSFLAFVAFSLIASSVYVVNDLADIEADRAHPRKRNRPFASGAIPAAQGKIIALALIVPGFALSLFVRLEFAFALLAYLALSTAYSFSLKSKLMIDIMTLAGLYTWRIVAGGIATGIVLSEWLLAFSIFFFLCLAAVKRQAELMDRKAVGKEQAVGRGYIVADLPIVIGMAITAGYVSVLVMALYLSSPAILELYARPSILWGVCLVLLYWISHMVMVTHRGQMHDDPLVFAIRDRISQTCLVLVAVFLLGGTLL